MGLLEQMSMPKTIKLYSGEEHTPIPSIWNYLFVQAVKNKHYAAKIMQSKSLQNKMCTISLEDAKEKNSSTVEEITVKAYRYFYLRAHLLDEAKYKGAPQTQIDPSAKRLWDELTKGQK